MTGPHEVYISDGHGVLTRLTPRLAAETLASFWEDQHTERHPMAHTVVVDDHTGEIFKQTLTLREVAEIEAGFRGLSLMGTYSIVTLDDGRKYRIEKVWDDLPNDDEA